MSEQECVAFSASSCLSGVTELAVLGGTGLLIAALCFATFKWGRSVERRDQTKRDNLHAAIARQTAEDVARGPVGAASQRLREQFSRSVPVSDRPTDGSGNR